MSRERQGPAAPPAPPTAHSFEANGPYLVVREGVAFPDRCVNCNASARGLSMKKRLFWSDAENEAAGGAWGHAPYVRYWFAFVSLFRWLRDLRTIRIPSVRVGICERHRVRAVLLTVFGVLGLPAGLTILVTGIRQQSTLWGGLLLFLAAGIALMRPRPVKAVHVGRGWITLAGVCPQFIAEVTAPPLAVAVPSENPVAAASSLRDRMAANRANRGE